LACVVFDQHFVFCRRDVKAELSNAGVRRREARADRAFGLIRAQGDFLYPDQISAVLDQQLDGLVVETPMRATTDEPFSVRRGILTALTSMSLENLG
jgi:hypothetical protein